MGVGTGGGCPLLKGGGFPGDRPLEIFENKDLFMLFQDQILINIIVISYLVELFIFEWIVQIRAHT